ncbi:ABC transporter ATP-binding protein [Vibrio salinus]|uniref:ABC transporter ATP-binding protein n=1 Tax=Vibrio salinus TaxID=2899784 RepID=UPI001E304081|nr:ABC transporter ATP-binding protein [Vibrio salinus]MCE0495267.1 ABC transporter ATP-binding protein [Vibrio salinus]
MAFLSLSNIYKNYSGRQVIRNINLSVEQGEFISLLGPSGCGKTTTLQMIAGFVDVTHGSITLKGKDITQTAPNQRGLGIVFQSYALFPHMTVAENVMFGLQMRKVEPSEKIQRTEKILKHVHLEQYKDRYPRHLSGGQRQRVALARALVINPDILLLDEPLSNLDAKLREEMQYELRRLQSSFGTTTLMVTHDQNEAMSISDRVVVMQDGEIVQVDTPQKLYQHPKNTFVSSFVGHSNLIEGTVTHTSKDKTLLAFSNNRQISLGKKFNFLPKSNVILSLRPESLFLAPQGRGRITGQLTEKFFMGSHWTYLIKTDIGQLEVLSTNNMPDTLAVGSSIELDWSDNDCRLLPTVKHSAEVAV